MPANGIDSPEMAAKTAGDLGADRYAPTAWGSRYEDLECPSGQTCKIRKVTVEDLIADGVIDDLDSLTKFVNVKHIEPKAKSLKKQGRSGNPAKAAQQDADATSMAKELLGGASSEDVRRMFNLMDVVTIAAVVAPTLHARVPEEERVQGLVYINDVDTTDKAFIFNYIFAGVKDLESFRKQLAENATAVVDVEDVEVQAK
jgi:hypothetical protein